MRGILKKLETLEKGARALDVTVKFRDQRNDVPMDFLQAAKLFVNGELHAIYAHDYDPEYDPLSELTLEELRALLVIAEKNGGELWTVQK